MTVPRVLQRKWQGYQPQYGEAHPQHKLTVDATDAIRDLYRSGVGPTHIARMYGVTPNLVWMIARRKWWNHDGIAIGADLWTLHGQGPAALASKRMNAISCPFNPVPP